MRTVESKADQPQKTIVAIVSTMRSGSTLLKALLAEAEDVSNLPEINFQRFQSPTARREIEAIDDARILVLKRPGWFHETSKYPRLPNVENVKTIGLVRDAYETVRSLKKMVFRQAHGYLGFLANGWLVAYWSQVVSRIREHADASRDAYLVRYEDILAEPKKETAKLFAFIDSQCDHGVDTYQAPQCFEWKWGQDDGGPRIKSLRVLEPVPHSYEDQRLLKAIKRSPSASQLRQRLGYPSLPE